MEVQVIVSLHTLLNPLLSYIERVFNETLDFPGILFHLLTYIELELNVKFVSETPVYYHYETITL